MFKKCTKLALCGLALVMGVSSAANAGGYQLNEYSITGLGRSFAGVGVVGDDYSALAYNPAGMYLKKSGFQAGLSVVQLKADVADMDDHSQSPGTIRLFSPVPNVFAQYKLDDRWDFGFGIYMPYGLSTKYSKNWFGSTAGVKSELIMVDMAPAVSFRVVPQFSLGGTLIVRYIKGNLTNRLPNIMTPGNAAAVPNSWSNFDGLDGWTVTGVLGAVWEPVQDVARIGFSWRLRSTQQVKGTHKINYVLVPGVVDFSGDGTGKASPDLPETFTLSGFYKPVDKIGLSGTVRYTRWARSFKEFTLESDTQFFQLIGGSSTHEYNWSNSWTIVGGVDYYHNDNWTFRVGGGWDESPSHNSYDRTVRIPDNDRIWASLGFSYMMKNLTIDVGFSHMFMKTTQAHEVINGQMLNTKYDSQGNMLGVGVQYAF